MHGLAFSKKMVNLPFPVLLLFKKRLVITFAACATFARPAARIFSVEVHVTIQLRQSKLTCLKYAWNGSTFNRNNYRWSIYTQK